MHTLPSELKQKHRAMWAAGDYPTVAETIADVREIDDDHFILFNHPEAIAAIVIEALENARRAAPVTGWSSRSPGRASRQPTLRRGAVR